MLSFGSAGSQLGERGALLRRVGIDQFAYERREGCSELNVAFGPDAPGACDHRFALRAVGAGEQQARDSEVAAVGRPAERLIVNVGQG